MISPKRYQLIPGSQLGHRCCFEATLVDTTRPKMIGGKHYNNEYAVVAEFFDEKEGQRVCLLLNTHEEP